MQWWQKIADVLGSQYLLLWWILVALYPALYGLARGWIGTGHGRTTIVFRCRQAVGFLFLVHLVATSGVLAYWWSNYSASKNAGFYLALYVLLAVFDIFGMLSQLLGNSRFQTYTR
jgi:hypothetical protein